MSETKALSLQWIDQPSRRGDLWLGVGVFVVALLVSWVAWSLIPGDFQENQSTDYAGFYEPVARNIIGGLGITIDGEIATRYPPGFPVIVAGAFGAGDVLGVSDATALLWLRLLCTGLSAVLVFALARLVWPPVGALIAGLAWITYPFGLWLTKQPNSEIAFIPLLLGAVYLLWRALLKSPRAWWLYLGSGLLLGAAMLVRPQGIGLGFVFALLVFLFARAGWPAKIGFAALILIGNLMLVGPWQAAINTPGSEYIPLSTGGNVSIKDGLTFLVVSKDYRREMDHNPELEALMTNIAVRRTEMKTTGAMVDVVLDEARQRPAMAAWFMGIKAVRSWYGTDSREFEGATMALQAMYLLLAVAGSWYAWRRGGDLRHLIAGNWLIVFYFWAMTIIVVPLLRYMLPSMSLLMIALPGVYYGLTDLLRRRAPTAAPEPAVD